MSRRIEDGPPIPQGPFPRAIKPPPEGTAVVSVEEIPGNEEYPTVPPGQKGQIAWTEPWAALAGYVYVNFDGNEYCADPAWLEVQS